MQYGQFCPIAKATEILGERWTILILRELLMGARRFGELQRGLGDISPALLSQRLRSLEGHGLLVRRRAAGLRQHEYVPTEAAAALIPSGARAAMARMFPRSTKPYLLGSAPSAMFSATLSVGASAISCAISLMPACRD